MKVAIVCDLLKTFLRFRLHLAKEIVSQGHELVVAVSGAEPDEIARFERLGARLVVIPMNRTGLNPLQDYLYYRKLTGFLLEERPDAVFAYHAKASIYTCFAARKLPQCATNVLFPGLGYLFSEAAGTKQRLVARIVKTLYRQSLKNLDRAIFQNPDDERTLRELQIFTSETKRVLVNGSGVPLDDFPASAPPTAPVRFLMTCRLLKDKGVAEYAAAARQLRARHGERVEFHLLGPFDTNPAAISPRQLAQWESECGLQYHGEVSDVRPWLDRSSVFVLPSYYMEGTPRSILEAMATGRAIVTADSRGCRETVQPGVNGFLVPPKQAERLAEALDRYVSQPELITLHGRESRELAERKFDVRLVNRQMLQAMELLRSMPSLELAAV